MNKLKLLIKTRTKSFKYYFLTGVGLIFYKLNKLKNKIIYARFRAKYEIDPSFIFNGNDIDFYGHGRIIIGSNSYIGNRSSICAEKGQLVKIGTNCSISHNVRIYTVNKNPIDVINEKLPITHIKGDVIIGDNCWIGANVFINQNVSIGHNTVIGANSVVTKNFPSNVIIAGCPAKIIKSKFPINPI